jgi:hypothetical protein
LAGTGKTLFSNEVVFIKCLSRFIEQFQCQITQEKRGFTKRL